MKTKTDLKMLNIDNTYASDRDAFVRRSSFHQVRIASSDSSDDVSAYIRDRHPLCHYIIGRDGRIFRIVSETRECSDPSILEVVLINLGPLMRSGTRFFPVAYDSHRMPYPDTSRPQEPHPYEYCTQNKYRSFAWYQNYTSAQLASLAELLRSVTRRHGIPSDFFPTVGQLMPQAAGGRPGIYLANAYNPHVTGAHPSQELVELLKTIAI